MTAALLDRPEIPADQAEVWAYVARAQQGDTEAFGHVYALYSFQILKFINARVKHVPTAEDLTADTFVRAFRKIGSVQWQGHNLLAWLMTIARNLVADYFKSPKRGEALLEDFAGINLAVADGADRSALLTLDGEAIQVALSRLTGLQRRVVELRYLQERSTAEAAEELGCTTGAAKALLLRALTTLRADRSVLALAGASC